jgi:hypothetical protein
MLGLGLERMLDELQEGISSRMETRPTGRSAYNLLELVGRSTDALHPLHARFAKAGRMRRLFCRRIARFVFKASRVGALPKTPQFKDVAFLLLWNRWAALAS